MFVLFDKQIARSITSGGRLYDRYCGEMLQRELKNKFNPDFSPLILGDTDSIYISVSYIIDNLIKSGKLENDDLVIAKYIEDVIEPILVKINRRSLDTLNDTYNVLRPEVLEYDREIIARCVTGETEVIVENDLMKIEELFNSFSDYKTSSNGVDYVDCSLSTKSFSLECGFIEDDRIVRVMRRKNTEQLVTLHDVESGKELTLTESHEVLVRNFKETKYSWVESKDIDVESILKRFVPGEISDEYVYDLEVENNHNFFANGMLIHNCGIVNGKKNYVMDILNNEGTEYHNGKLKIIGLQVKKTNIPGFIRKELLELLKILLRGDEVTFQSRYKKYKEDYINIHPDDIAFPKGCNILSETKGREYTLSDKGIPINVRSALLYNSYIQKYGTKYEEITTGEKIKFVYLKTPNPIGQNVIGYPNKKEYKDFLKDEGLDKFIDYKRSFEGNVFKPLDDLVKNRGWDFEKKNTLF